MMDYNEMLSRARENMPKGKSDERLQIPKPDIISGKYTIIKNFSDIVKTIRRDSKHLSKNLFRNLAVPGNIEKNSLKLQGRVSTGLINEKLNDYYRKYLYCNECKKPDTNMKKDRNIVVIKCESCGASKTVKDE